jgi:uncharacterized protein (TIGR03437 family)
VYAGAAPGIVAGVVQVNFRVPADLPVESAIQTQVRVTVIGAGPNPPMALPSSIFVAP